MASAAFLIYSGIMPLIKTFLAIFCGYFLARKDLFPAAASRGASQVTMNVSLPALVFANIVPAFTPQNISAIGPLFLTAFVYMLIGFGGGMVIREICYVPRNFWQGIIIVSGMSNWGNLPNAVVLSVTAQPPFNPITDPQLGVSFVSIFIISYHLVFWACGAAHSLSWDYLPGVPQGEEAELRLPWRGKPLGSLFYRYVLRQGRSSARSVAYVESATPGSLEASDPEKKENHDDAPAPSRLAEQPSSQDKDVPDLDMQLTRRSRISATPQFSCYPSSLPNTPHVPAASPHPVALADPTSTPTREERGRIQRFVPPIAIRALKPLAAVVSPVTVSIAISLPIALIEPLKALFVDVSASGGPNWKGPDGRPPLAFLIDTASFIGDMAIPLALVMLGASFARLRIPRPLSRLPILAMLAVSFLKMALLPIVGVFMIQGMVKGGLISKDSRAEKFVAMFLSGTPAAVNQLIVSSIYAPDGNVDTLSAFLLVQYVFMFFSSSALTAVALLLS